MSRFLKAFQLIQITHIASINRRSVRLIRMKLRVFVMAH